MWHSVRTVAGIALLIVGLLGLLLPVMPGIPFLVAAVAVLGMDHAIVRWGRQRLDSDRPWIRRLRTWLERRGILKPHQS